MFTALKKEFKKNIIKKKEYFSPNQKKNAWNIHKSFIWQLCLGVVCVCHVVKNYFRFNESLGVLM
jgi:hypothetical protein